VEDPLPATSPIAALFPGYQRAWLSTDLAAGVSVAAVAIPVAIAYAKLAGVPPVYGLYASLLPLVIYAVLGSSRQLIIAPDAATCAIVAAVVTPLAGADPARYVALSAGLAMIGGVFCIAAGLARMGFLTNFLSRPILTGYLNGIAICIIMSQLGAMCGVTLAPAGFFRMLWNFGAVAGQTHVPTVALGLGTLAALFVCARVVPRVPAPLLAAIGGIAASAWFHLGDHGVHLLGAIPAGLPWPRIPALSAADWQALVTGALGLALISYNSAMVTARGFAEKNRYDIDSNREFIALGACDIGSGILSGFAVSGADSRTAMNDAVGGKSKLVGLVAAVVIALTLVFLTGPLALLPGVVLAAILITAAIGLFDLAGLATLRRLSPSEFRISLVTLLGVITVGVLPGVGIAIGMAMIGLLARASRPHDAVLGRMPGSGEIRNRATNPEAAVVPGLLLYRFDSALLFFNADHFKARVLAVVREAPGPLRVFVLVAEVMPFLDTTGAETLDEVRADLAAAGTALAVAGAHQSVRGMLERSGLTKKIGADHMFPTVESAIAALAQAAP